MASSSSSSSQAALLASRGAEEEKEKPRLTDREKKANHIASGMYIHTYIPASLDGWMDHRRTTMDGC